jgi:hypothetical protein
MAFHLPMAQSYFLYNLIYFNCFVENNNSEKLGMIILLNNKLKKDFTIRMDDVIMARLYINLLGK